MSSNFKFSHHRPDPDQLLKHVVDNERRAHRGKLKIFFGSCPGVGKTYSMLLAAHERLGEGLDVVAGIVETHGRVETEKLLEGLPSIPHLVLNHRGIDLREFDLDAAKARNAALVLVDELAHTNAPGTRHAKRWNDIEELLAAGIDVYTTLNVQHIESLSDVVAGSTGIWVKETVPDLIFDNAHDIILVDINVDELRKRLKEGKVYTSPDVRTRALENFFKKQNLTALREIALRRTAERVEAQMEADVPPGSAEEIFPVSERIMVCIGPDPLSAKLVRTAKRMATSLKAPWTAVYIENLRHYRLNQSGRQSVQAVARMAERMGAKSVVLQGDNVVDEIIGYARANRITKIIIGKPIKPPLQTMVFGALADKVIHRSDHIDVYVVTGERGAEAAELGKNELQVFRPKLYFMAFVVVTLLTILGTLIRDYINPADQGLIYLTGVVLVASQWGRGPSLLYSLLGVSAFNFFFVPPIYSFDVYDRSYLLTFLVMLVTSFVITDQASRLRLQTRFARKRERDTQTFYALTKDLASTRGFEDISRIAARHIDEMLDSEISVWLPNPEGNLEAVLGGLPGDNFAKEVGVLRWCFDNSQLAGRNTTTMPSAEGFYMPLQAGTGTIGVMSVVLSDAARELTGEEIASLQTCANLLASALERASIADIMERSRLETESERLRMTLLSSVSHDLRTPLASITGASSTIAANADRMPLDTIRDLGRSINKEAQRLSNLVSNLLEVTRLESGAVQLNRQPYFIEELIGSVRSRAGMYLCNHRVNLAIEKELPLVSVDGVLIEQLLQNLLENAAFHTPASTIITISARRQDGDILVGIVDNGPGIPPTEEKKVFGKFYTVSQNPSRRGTGLGLAICASIVKVHKGKIWVEPTPGGGASFYFTLPVANDQTDGNGENVDER